MSDIRTKDIGDVERLCWFCRHFSMRHADGPYSDLTPGSDFDMDCAKRVWIFDAYSTTELEMGRMLTTARECEHFDLREEIVMIRQTQK